MEKGGISFSGLLFIILLVLKLVKVISISWVWVFAPLWIPLGITLICIIIIGIFIHQKGVIVMREVIYKVTKPGRVGFAKRKTLEHAQRTAQDIHGEYRAVLVNPEIATKTLIASSPMRQRMIAQFGRVHPSLKNRVDKQSTL